MATAWNLNAIGNVCPFSDVGVSQDAIRANVDMARQAGMGMSKERTKVDAAGKRSLRQGEPVVGNPQIISGQTWSQSENLRKEDENTLDPPEA